MYFSIGACDKLSRLWNKTEDEKEKKKLTIMCWFMRFYCEKSFSND